MSQSRSGPALSLALFLAVLAVTSIASGARAAWVDVSSPPVDDGLDGEGVAFADVDGDGDLDLFLVNIGDNMLFRNDGGGTFADVTTVVLGDFEYSSGAVFGDIDNDGDLDLYLTNDGSNRMFRNEGGGNFVDATTPVLSSGGPDRGAAFGDYDDDGDLDLYIGTDDPNKLLRNEGGGVFVDVTSGPLGTSEPTAVPHFSLRSSDAPPYTQHLLETQIGGGPAWGTGGFGGIAQLHARFALWHTIGLGLYAGGLMVGSQDRDPLAAIPLVGRLNLSLPFWPSFEPVGSIGIGPYFFVSENETSLGAQAALALLFPGRKFGVETILHVTEDPRYSSELAGYLTLAVTALYR